MSRITRQDTNGVKPLLATGEFGYDNYPAGGDAGRIYVGTGTENIPVAKKSEVDAVDDKANAHIVRVDNPHSVTKTQVGLGNVDNTSDVNKPISTATQAVLDLKVGLTESQTIAGVKTFSSNPISTATQSTATNALTRKDYVDGLNSTNVKLTGNQTIAGVKTFSSTISGSISGNAATATKLATARTITLSGDVSGNTSFDGSDNVSITATIADNSHIHSTSTITGLGTASVRNVGDGINDVLPANIGFLELGKYGSGDRHTFIDFTSAGAPGTVDYNARIIRNPGANGDLYIVNTGTGNIVFGSSPIVPTPTTDFQATTARSTNIIVNVGAGQTYTTINQALEYLSGFYPLHKSTGVIATINLKAGFVMKEQVLVRGLNLGWITIVGEDAETIITHTSLTTAFNGNYPAFGVDQGGTSPVIGQLFRFNVEKVGGNKHGIMAIGAGSSATVLSGKGFNGAGHNGIYAVNGSTINANGAYAHYAGNAGIYAASGSTISATGAYATMAGAHGIFAAGCSTINANGAIVYTAAQHGIYAVNGSTINAEGADASFAGINGIYAVYGSTINAANAYASAAGNAGIYAGSGSTINANGVKVENQTAGANRVRVAHGSTIDVSGISTTNGTVPVFSQAINTLTDNGIIYQ